jgi:hypothetical protein
MSVTVTFINIEIIILLFALSVMRYDVTLTAELKTDLHLLATQESELVYHFMTQWVAFLLLVAMGNRETSALIISTVCDSHFFSRLESPS